MSPEIPPLLGPDALERYNVIVHNCECHNVREVIGAFMHFAGMDHETAYSKMALVNNMGRAIVATTHQERAELIATRLATEAINYAGAGLLVSVELAKAPGAFCLEQERDSGVYPDVNW